MQWNIIEEIRADNVGEAMHLFHEKKKNKSLDFEISELFLNKLKNRLQKEKYSVSLDDGFLKIEGRGIIGGACIWQPSNKYIHNKLAADRADCFDK